MFFLIRSKYRVLRRDTSSITESLSFFHLAVEPLDKTFLLISFPILRQELLSLRTRDTKFKILSLKIRETSDNVI